MAQEYLICDKQELIAIADAVRIKTGSTDTYTVSELPDAIEAIEAGGKTTKTINIDWSGDEERTCTICYISNNQIISTEQGYDVYETIEAEGGIIIFSDDRSETSSNFINLGMLYGYSTNGSIYVATQDGETVYPISSDTI